MPIVTRRPEFSAHSIRHTNPLVDPLRIPTVSGNSSVSLRLISIDPSAESHVWTFESRTSICSCVCRTDYVRCESDDDVARCVPDRNTNRASLGKPGGLSQCEVR